MPKAVEREKRNQNKGFKAPTTLVPFPPSHHEAAASSSSHGTLFHLANKMASVSISPSSSPSFIQLPAAHELNHNPPRWRPLSSIEKKTKQKRRPSIIKACGHKCKCGKSHVITHLTKWRFQVSDGERTVIVIRSKKLVLFNCGTCGFPCEVLIIQ